MAAGGISGAELEELIARTEAAANAWVRGDPGPYGEIASSEDFTITGPFGGPTVEGRSAYDRVAPAAAAQFANGEAKLRVIRAHASGNLLVLILEEQQRTELGGREQPWTLRVTQVYRREPEGWRVIHRHADPLVRRRSIEEAAALARE